MEKAVVCVSGGMDSLAATAVANINYELVLLHINYGQRTEQIEAACFELIASWYKVPDSRLFRINTNIFSAIGHSCLTDKSIKVPKDENPKSEGIPISYVPFRNGNILAMATSIAEAKNASKIFTGFVEQDNSGYPDCREVFVERFRVAIREGVKPTTQIEIETPTLHMSKSEVIQFAISLNAPLHLSWSCYERSDKACGTCDSCQLRLRGFMRAGYIDPLPYLINIDWKSCKKYEIKGLNP